MKPFLIHSNPYDLACLATLFSGLTLALLLGFAKKPEKNADVFLSLALVVTVLNSGGLSATFFPALGPLLYFYTRRLTLPERRFQRKDWLRFCLLLTGSWIPSWLVLLCIIAYLYFSHRLIQDFYNRLQPVFMDRPRSAFRRLDKSLTLLCWFCALTLLNDKFVLAVAFVLIGMAVEIILKTDRPVKIIEPMPDRSDSLRKARRIKEMVAANHFYEDAELTLTTLAEKLNLHPHDLSRIINIGLDKNFNDFINEFRVREVIRKMHDPAYNRLTLLGIAYESGFNSKTTFNRVFKEMTGRTPAEYKNSLKKEVPNHKLVPVPVIGQVILRSASLSTSAAEPSKQTAMIWNYLTITYRQLLKQKMYAAIQIGGFALGIAACLLIGLYILEETNYDRNYPDADRIYRLAGDGTLDTGYDWPAPMAKAIQNDFPEVAYAGRINITHGMQLRRADHAQTTYQQGFIYADQPFLDALQLPVLFGNARAALTEPFTMVISKTMADKYYPGQNPVGQAMYLDNDLAHPYQIRAVMADIPKTSHLHQFNFLLTLAGKEFWDGEQTSWGSYNYRVYIKLKTGVNVAAFEKKLKARITSQYLLPQFLSQGMKGAEIEIKKVSFKLQPVKDINLYSYGMPDGFAHGDIRLIWLFGGIALFILLIACINFINLSTAKSANRAREVGLRKVVGSYRSSLIMQFLTESMIYSLIAFILGVAIAWLLLPYFNSVASKSLAMPWTEWWTVPVILVSVLIVGSLAGLYPAFYLSGFRPVQVLKGTISGGSKSPMVRNSLVVFQFAASIVLITSTIVIYHQTHFILSRKVGFDKDQVMVLQGTNTLGDAMVKTFKNELSKIASVKSVSISDYLPIENETTKRNNNVFFKEGREKLDDGILGQFWEVDDTYLKTMGMKLVEGRDFSGAMASDTAGGSVIINQTFARKLKLENPVGKRISNGGIFTVVGVVEDFNFNSMRGDIGPLVLHYGISPSMITVKFSGSDSQATVADVSDVWKKFAPNQPIRYTFLDDQFATMYADVISAGRLFTSFSVLAIIIACLGLFALSAFMAEQRKKEIGIRKVLGSSVPGIITLLSGDFVKLVLLAIVISTPIAWWAMNRWLEDFAYRIAVQWWMFAAAGLGALLIALLTVSFQSVKAALVNPVKSLRSE